MPERSSLGKKAIFAPFFSPSSATIRAKKVPNEVGIRRLSSHERRLRQPGVGLFLLVHTHA
jgi:hypothetical protein